MGRVRKKDWRCIYGPELGVRRNPWLFCWFWLHLCFHIAVPNNLCRSRGEKPRQPTIHSPLDSGGLDNFREGTFVN